MLIQSIVKNGIWLISLGLFASLSFSEESKDAVSGYHPDLTASEDSEQRSPDEYSDGLTLSSGPSLFEGREQLSLADEHTFSSLLIDIGIDATTPPAAIPLTNFLLEIEGLNPFLL